MKLIVKLFVIFSLFISFIVSSASINEGIKLFNHKEFTKSKEIFSYLAKQGDANALFWLGIVEFNTGEQYKAGETLLKSAEKGNPWAMLMLSPSKNGYCDYLGWPCDDEWKEKGFSLLEKMAENGDGDAEYVLLYRRGLPWWASIPILNEKKGYELADKFAHLGFFKIANFMNLPMDIGKRVELLEYGADHGDVQSMNTLFDIYKSEKHPIKNGIQYAKKALSFGSIIAAWQLKYFYADKIPYYVSDNKFSDIDKNNLEKVYYYDYIASKLNNDEMSEYIVREVKNEEGKILVAKIASFDSIDDDTKKEIEKKACDYLESIQPLIGLDETSSISSLLNFNS